MRSPKTSGMVWKPSGGATGFPQTLWAMFKTHSYKSDSLLKLTQKAMPPIDNLLHKPVQITTDRLTLRRARNGDAALLFKDYCGDVECSRFLQRKPHETAGKTEAMLARWANTAWETEGASFTWVISLRETLEPIGLFLAIADGHRLEIHYGIAQRFWGQGLVAEAGVAALKHLQQSPGIQRIWTVCDIDNIGSRRVLEKLGMQYEGILRRWLVLPAFGTEARDCHAYAWTRPSAINHVTASSIACSDV